MLDMTITKLNTKPRTRGDMQRVQITENPLNGTHHKPRQTENKPGRNLTCLDNGRNTKKLIKCMDMPMPAKPMPSHLDIIHNFQCRNGSWWVLR